MSKRSNDGTVKVCHLDPDYHEATLQRIAAIIPPFLVREGRRLTHEEARNLNVPNISWAPFRDYTQPRPKEPSPKLWVSDRTKPVAVSIRGQDGVARHEGMDAFEAAHDLATYPVARCIEMEDEIIVQCTAKPWAGREKASPKPKASGRSKAQMVGELLLRPEGCTTKDVLEATGWPSVSMPAQAKAVGLRLRKEKVDGAMRYWGSK